MLAAAQEKQGPATVGKAFAALATAQGGDSRPASSSGASCSRPARGGGGAVGAADAARGSTAHPGAGGLVAAAAAVSEDPAEPDVLLPFSDELRGGRRYCLDLQGRVWLAGGWLAHAVAPSLAALLRRTLT